MWSIDWKTPFKHVTNYGEKCWKIWKKIKEKNNRGKKLRNVKKTNIFKQRKKSWVNLTHDQMLRFVAFMKRFLGNFCCFFFSRRRRRFEKLILINCTFAYKLQAIENVQVEIISIYLEINFVAYNLDEL